VTTLLQSPTLLNPGVVDSQLAAYVPRYKTALIDICTDFGVTPGSDLTTEMQSAINQLNTAGVSGEIFFSRPGTYGVDGAIQSGSGGGSSWAGQILFPALDSSTPGVGIAIRGIGRPSAFDGSGIVGKGVILQSTATSGAVFAVKAPGTGLHPSASEFYPSFDSLVIECATGGSAIDLLNANAAGLNEIVLKNSYHPGDSSFGLQLPQANVGDWYTVNNLMVYGFGSSAVITECAKFRGVFLTEGGDVSVLCNGGGDNIIEYLNAQTTTVFSAAHLTSLVANVLWQPGCGQLIDDPATQLMGTIRLWYGDYAFPGQHQGPPSVVGGAGALGSSAVNAGWLGEPSSRDRHPSDTFSRIVAAPTSSGYPGLCSETLHSWRTTQGGFNVIQPNGYGTDGVGGYKGPGNLFSTTSGGQAQAMVRTLDGDRGGRSRVVSGTFTLAGGAPRPGLICHSVYGGSNSLQAIQTQLIGGTLYLQVGVGGGTVTSVGTSLVAGDTFTLSLAVTIGADKLPTRAQLILNGERVLDHWLTAAQRNAFTGGSYPFFEDGLFFYADTSSYCSGFIVTDLADEEAATSRTATAAIAQSGGGTITPDANAGTWQTITVADATAFTIAAATNPPFTSVTQRLTIEVFNNSGGAMGAVTWNAAYVFAGLAWTNPATGKRRYAEFEWNGTEWVCKAIAGADY